MKKLSYEKSTEMPGVYIVYEYQDCVAIGAVWKHICGWMNNAKTPDGSRTLYFKTRKLAAEALLK